jgi:hypothetical protein
MGRNYTLGLRPQEENKMFRTLIVTLVLVLASPAFAQDLPKHYPKEGFQRTGLVDAIYVEDSTMVINDIPFRFSQNVVVHSMTSYRVPFTQVREGVRVGYKMANSGEIIELWLLPDNYSDRRQR